MQPHCTQCVHRHHHHQPRQFTVVNSIAQVPLSSSAVSPDPAFTPLIVESSPDVYVSSDSQSSSQPTYQYVCPLSLMGVNRITYWSPGVASLPHKCQPPLHPSYGDCLEVKREYYQNCSMLGCVTQCSQSAAHSYEQFLQVQQIGFVTLGPLYHA